jgi:hypothetical protein
MGAMLKRVIFIMGMLNIIGLLLAGCSTEANTPAGPSPGEQFTLPVGQSVSIKGENLTIKFEKVTNDSRCPTGVQCIWAGEAKCQMSVTSNGSVSTIVLTVSGASEAVGQPLVQNYKANFQLHPYPEAGKQIAEQDYKLIMTVSK